MKNIEKLLDLQERNTHFNGWFGDCNDFYYYFALLDELAEAKYELVNHDFEKLEDEMGDVLWNLLNFISKLESRGYLNSERMIEGSYQKFSERMPYVAEGRLESSRDIRLKLWNEAKARQKEEKIK